MSHLAKIKEKGISPLIASVLLLAFVLSIAGIFSEWG
ncbi:MAG: archaellin/type IV pilin N-terminal domain-containing protein, partial [Candidatus Aenigmatarchaeota archaeon]